MKFIKQFASLAAFNGFTLDSNNTPNVSLIQENYGIQYTKYIQPPHNYSQDYFTIEAIDNISVSMSIFDGGSSTYNPLYYSINNGNTWSQLNTPVSLSAGEKAIFKGIATANNASDGTVKFNDKISGRFNVSGNIMSLVYGDDFIGQTTFPSVFTNYGSWGFNGLFSEQNKLISAENLILPVTTLIPNCYNSMFYGCSSLTTAPELPASILVKGCYEYMFRDCSSLNYIKCLATSITYYDDYEEYYRSCAENWVVGVANSGTFIKASSATGWENGGNGIPSGWTVQNAQQPPHNYSQDYFTIEAIDNIDVLLSYKNSLSPDNPVGTMYYSVNKGSTWSEMDSMVSLSAGEKIMFKGVATKCLGSSATFGLTGNGEDEKNGLNDFINGRFNVEGNIMSVIYGDDFIGQTSFPAGDPNGKWDWNYAFYSFFYDQINLINAGNLILPVTTLVNNCYSCMFYGCKSLTTAPELPATTLVNGCYDSMFSGCTSLNYVKCLATSIQYYNYNNESKYATDYWLNGVAASGTFIKNSSMNSWPEGDNGIPSGWTVQDA